MRRPPRAAACNMGFERGARDRPRMGRRSSHSPGELRHLILQSARGLVQKSGLNGLSARAIAKNIGYSPGTLYSVFSNRDELLLRIQGALLEELIAELDGIPAGGRGAARLHDLSDAYISFALRNRELWNLLQQHTPRPGKLSCELIDQNFQRIIALVADAIKSHASKATDADIQQMAHAMWASIHGISAMAVADKIGAMPIETARPCVSVIVDCFQSRFGQLS